MKVVQLHRHKVIQGDDMYAKTYQFGNTIVHIDDSYSKSKTPEQDELDNERTRLAAWAIIDELVERGEAV